MPAEIIKSYFVLVQKKNIYFASDVHLGAPTIKDYRQHEKRFVRWLDQIKEDADEIYLLGDIFDFWFEYRHVIPKGQTRFLGKLCELTDAGISVHFFTGNHDIWVFDYLPREMGVVVHTEPYVTTLHNKKFYMAHGDGLTPDEKSYKRLKAVFTNRMAQRLFRWLHPDLGVALARFWSRKSRERNQHSELAKFQGEENEWLIKFSKEILKQEHFDFFVFGHRHVAIDLPIGNHSRVCYLGDWVRLFTYAVWDGKTFELKHFKN
ncbi:UDP-2,3-diacylglucosamine diphosphatase [Thermophagus xiamenensis]|uniref:UDP-2,3-diacylglucosamine hydrolase n=1 Tax=Thermophagus xiamenensis TaxID=385682 RepID=A0A1I2CJL7_9BACT|nr:UDP-2,3-diacylglucosamine diphosphatase [Thermophagus xiamenensis]SFE68537.1 UDP-2,3-diacylglucosamine hydrolase [Thermophagus xiamenensis]